jgi:hypothetical protein
MAFGNNEQYQNRPEGQKLFYAYDGLGSVATIFSFGTVACFYHE